MRNWIKNLRFGYTSGQAGIIRRMLREEGGWQSHLFNSSEYIVKRIRLQKPKSIRILGSGWLLDVPMQYLLDNCDRIVLVDVIHPNQILNRYSQNQKVVFEKVDITGGIIDFCYQQKRKSYDHESFIQGIYNVVKPEYPEDVVVSLNVLSQLSVFIVDYLFMQLKISDVQAMEIAEAIQQAHLEMLPKGKTILISDFEEEYYGEEDRFIGSKPTVYATIPNGVDKKEWVWNFDSKFMYKPDCKTRLRVFAMNL